MYLDVIPCFQILIPRHLYWYNSLFYIIPRTPLGNVIIVSKSIFLKITNNLHAQQMVTERKTWMFYQSFPMNLRLHIFKLKFNFVLSGTDLRYISWLSNGFPFEPIKRHENVSHSIDYKPARTVGEFPVYWRVAVQKRALLQ
jgi:hypothetical protein